MFNIYFDELEVDGKIEVNEFLVVVPKRLKRELTGGVAVLPVVNGSVGLINIYRHPIESYLWEVPRGFVDAEGETVEAAAIRELEEETGLSCESGDVRSVGLIAPEPGIIRARIHLYVALNCKGTTDFEPTELGHKEFRLFEIEQVERMIAKSQIQDPCTLISYYKYKAGHF